MSSPIKNALADLVATFRAEVDSYQVRAYERSLKGIDGEVVLRAADLLIDEASAGRKFYPMPSAPEWKQACAKVIGQQRREAFQRGLAGCDHAPSFMEEYQDERGVWWTRRCSCYQRAKQLMEAVGEPLALPSYTEPEENR